MRIYDVVIMVFASIGYFVALCLIAADYIMTSLSYYTIAKKRLVSKPWLAWIPLAREWLAGSIADEYAERNGHKRNWRTLLVVLKLLAMPCIVAMSVIPVLIWYGVLITPNEDELLILFAMISAIMLVLLLLFSAYRICKAVCHFKIFESTIPKAALLCLVISIIIPLAQGICLLICRNKGYEYEIYQEEEPVAEDSETTLLPDQEQTETEDAAEE